MTAKTTTQNSVAKAIVHSPGLAACAAAGLSLAAALIHLWVIPEHFAE